MENEIHELRERIEKIEARPDFNSRGLGITSGDLPEWTISSTVLALIQKRRKDDAIRTLIEEAGASLKDAKTVI